MPIFNTEQRKVAIETAKQESRRQDVKQHCTKIRDGIERLDKNSGDRAIWELIQNARDLSDNACISIKLENHLFTFEHQGEPFTFDSLSSLVKQVSSQSKESEHAVGQYGTGFLTTHKFSRQIQIEASFRPDPLNNPDVFFNIDDLTIDREFSDIPEFVEKMANQIKAVEQILEEEKPAPLRPYTKLKYPLSDSSYLIAKRAVDSAVKLMPYVMVINENIEQCQIDDKEARHQILFTKESLPEEEGLKVMRINILENGDFHTFDCYYLESLDKKDKIIFPLETATKTRNIDDIAKLFLFFPLLGTENFGVNFIFHSERFYPEESRDGILLPRDNTSVVIKYENNVKILYEMSEMIFNYLRTHIQNIEGSIEMAAIDIDTSFEDEYTQEFYEKIRERWTDEFKNLPIIQTANGRFGISDNNALLVFDSVLTDILSTEENESKYLDVLYYYGSKVAVLPIKEESIRWSQIINRWKLPTNNIFLSIDGIAKKVSEDYEGELHKFLEVVNICQQSGLFTKYELIPNREGRLQMSTILKDGKTITPELYTLARPIVTSSMDKLVDQNYVDIIPLDEYTRKNLQSDISSKLSAERYETLDNRLGDSVVFADEFSKALRRYCCAFTVAEGESNRSRIMKQICLINNENFVETIIPRVSSDDPDLYDTAFRTLLENELLNISTRDSDWVKNNHLVLLELVRNISQVRDSDFQKRYFPKYAVFPNQKQQLCLAAELKINKGTDEDLAILYQKVFIRDIHEQWVHEDFSTFYEFLSYDAKDVAREIEDSLEENGYASELTIDIIDAIDNEHWKGLFKNIESKKEEIFFTRVPKQNKSSVYKLMKICDNNILETLADLADNPRMNEILIHAERLMEEEKRRLCDFNFKHDIGKHIEAAIRERISTELGTRIQVRTKNDPNSDWIVNDIQNGQDIIISIDNQDVYYVEVKAKWSFNVDSAHMSKNQMNMAIRHADNYSLCCVDLTNQNENYYPEMSEIINNTYIHLRIADKLQNIMGGIVRADNNKESIGITMGGDYRCNIPKYVFIDGTTFDTLISAIVEKTQK